MKLLTICIPTYNRSEYLISILEFLKKETSIYKHLIDIKVADNHSDLFHIENTKNYRSLNSFFELNINNENLGLIGNVYYLLELTNSKYVWFLGDDDILLDGIIDNLINIIKDDFHTYYVFFNHSVFTDNPLNCVSAIDLVGHSNKVKNGKECLIDLFSVNGTVNMFMSASIYPVESINNFIRTDRNKIIVDPLLFSFYAAAVNDVYIVSEIFVLDRMSNTSWSKESGAVYSWLVPYALIELVENNYTKSEIKSILINYFYTCKGNYLRMLIQAPNYIKTEIISFLGLKQLKLIFPSSIFNVKRLIEKL